MIFNKWFATVTAWLLNCQHIFKWLQMISLAGTQKQCENGTNMYFSKDSTKSCWCTDTTIIHNCSHQLRTAFSWYSRYTKTMPKCYEYVFFEIFHEIVLIYSYKLSKTGWVPNLRESSHGRCVRLDILSLPEHGSCELPSIWSRTVSVLKIFWRIAE